MKKILILTIAIFGLFFYSHKTEAITIVIGPNADEVLHRYAGSFLVEDNNFTKQYWYLDPESKERYLLEDGKDLSRLLRTLGQGITNANLNKIPLDDSADNVDYNFVHQMEGKILLQVEDNGQAWYVHPLDNYRYALANGQDGFETIQKMALEISPAKLNAIKITKNKNFNDIDEDRLNFEMFNTVKSQLANAYYKPELVNDQDLFYGSLKGLAESLEDPYTEFFTPQGKQEFEDNIDGTFEGIGSVVDSKNNRLIIISPLDNSPAMRAGLQPQDQVWTVDGLDIEGFSTDESVELIKGPAGTKVILGIYRPSTDEFFEVEITRDTINLENVTGEIIDNRFAYIRINMFSPDLVGEFETVKNSVINENTKGVIIDLRNNPGGYTNSALNLADYWLDPRDLIVEEEYNNQTLSYQARLEREINLPTVILVNSGTASASEIFSSALRDHQAAEIVGTTTFGKGTGQQIMSFDDNSALKYTVFAWFTPAGNSVEGTGIEPDYIVENIPNRDKQLQTAKNLLK